MAGPVARPFELPPKIGRHIVLGYLADGGMAEIFLGKELDGRPVVIKRILPHLARQQNFVSMFIDEARIGSLVHHPNVVEVYELGQVGLDLFLVMEYLAGESVSGVMRRLISRGERMPFALAAHIVAEACAGLHAAHELTDEYGHPLGLVHRDVSPQNLMITYDGGVKVLDFGIATAAHRLTRTATGQVKGKFSYMSPEQCRGEHLDPRSDIFSLGVLLFELTTQRRLFKRPNELMVLKAVTEQPIRRPSREVPDYPAALEAICMRALERQKEERYQSALELRDELLAIAGQLDAPGDPRAELSRVMGELFAERIVEKRSMLSHVRAGTDVGTLPAAEVDEGIEVPQVEEASATPLPSAPAQAAKPAAPQARSAAGLIVLGLGALAAGAIALGWYASQGDEPRGPVAAETAPAAPTSPAPVAALAAVDARSEITLHVDTVPAGAEVTVDAELRGVTPVDVRIAPGEHVVAIVATGFDRVEQTLSLDGDQRLLIPLVATRPVPVVATPVGKPATKPKKPPVRKPPSERDPFKRYD